MIDWVSFSVPYSGPPVGVQYLKRERWDLPPEPAFNKPVQVEGSYSSKLQVQAIGSRLYISGNPVKFFTGQNVVGTNDLRRLVVMTVEAVMDRLGLFECPLMLKAVAEGDVTLTRVDCTFSYRVGTDAQVKTWLAAMGDACHVRFRGRGHFDEGMCSLMFGLTMQGEGKKAKGSRRSTFKFYNKWQEIGAHPMTCRGDVATKLREQVYGTVRGEACYRALELQRYGKARLSEWTESTAIELHRSWVERMEMPETYSLHDDEVTELPRRLRGTYHMWRAGVDVREVLSRRTFYEHRKDLMERGIDISAPRPDGREPVKAIAILEVLKATPIAEDDDEALFWRLAA